MVRKMKRFRTLQDILDNTAWIPGCGCMLWLGSNNGNYGLFFHNRKSATPIHRRVKELELGRELEQDELALHKCDNRLCCRPDHIFVGTHSDNVSDMWKKNRHIRLVGELNTQSKLTSQQVSQVAMLRKSGVSSREIASRFSVWPSTINSILRGQYWKHVKQIGPLLMLIALPALAQLSQLNDRLTSDATLTRAGMAAAPVPPGAIFVPPSEFIFIQWRTNHVPLVVREEISSNVFRASVWWANGKPQTNFALMASNLISVATNVVQ